MWLWYCGRIYDLIRQKAGIKQAMNRYRKWNRLEATYGNFSWLTEEWNKIGIQSAGVTMVRQRKNRLKRHTGKGEKAIPNTSCGMDTVTRVRWVEAIAGGDRGQRIDYIHQLGNYTGAPVGRGRRSIHLIESHNIGSSLGGRGIESLCIIGISRSSHGSCSRSSLLHLHHLLWLRLHGNGCMSLRLQLLRLLLLLHSLYYGDGGQSVMGCLVLIAGCHVVVMMRLCPLLLLLLRLSHGRRLMHYPMNWLHMPWPHWIRMEVDLMQLQLRRLARVMMVLGLLRLMHLLRRLLLLLWLLHLLCLGHDHSSRSSSTEDHQVIGKDRSTANGQRFTERTAFQNMGKLFLSAFSVSGKKMSLKNSYLTADVVAAAAHYTDGDSGRASLAALPLPLKKINITLYTMCKFSLYTMCNLIIAVWKMDSIGLTLILHLHHVLSGIRQEVGICRIRGVSGITHCRCSTAGKRQIGKITWHQ